MLKSRDRVKQHAKKIINDQKKEQIQDIMQALIQSMQEAVTNKSINPDLKTLFDIESNKEVITSIREPDPGMLVQQRPIMLMPEKHTIYRRHIPPQTEIDNALTELCTKVIRQLVVHFETADLIREYDRSTQFKDIYAYIARNKLPGNQQVQRRVLGEAANYVVVNKLLFKLERVKEGKYSKVVPLLVIPEKFETNIFHMYHNSLICMPSRSLENFSYYQREIFHFKSVCKIA